MTSVAVIGPGAIGGTIAAWLSREPGVDPLILCARTPLDRLVVETPDGLIEASPKVLTDPAQVSGPVDWVLAATKAYDVAGTARWMIPLVGPATRVAVLQNGVEHVERFSPYVDADRILPVVVDLPAERTAPGRIAHRRSGSMTVPAGEAGEAFSALFRNSIIEVSVTDDFATAAWTKLALNCAGAVCALIGQPAGVVARPGIAETMAAMVRECVAVGRAEGASLSDDLADQVVARTRSSPPDSINSLLGDRLAGRPMEWDARNGVIARKAARHDLEAPLNQMAAALLRAMEAGD